MNTETIKLLEQLATKLGTSVEHILTVFTKQAMVNSLTWIITDIIFLIFIVISIKKVKEYKGEWDDGIAYLHVTTLTISFAFVIAIIVSISSITQGLFCPEATAIENLFKLF
jgi:hypothetical protein